MSMICQSTTRRTRKRKSRRTRRRPSRARQEKGGSKNQGKAGGKSAKEADDFTCPDLRVEVSLNMLACMFVLSFISEVTHTHTRFSFSMCSHHAHALLRFCYDSLVPLYGALVDPIHSSFTGQLRMHCLLGGHT